MPEGIELIGLLATRCFCVVQNQKGVADAMIEAQKGRPDPAPRTSSSTGKTRP